jgi:hypothetical protein
LFFGGFPLRFSPPTRHSPATLPPHFSLQCPLTGFPLDYSYKDVSEVKVFLEEPPFAGVAKGMDRKSLPKVRGTRRARVS